MVHSKSPGLAVGFFNKNGLLYGKRYGRSNLETNAIGYKFKKNEYVKVKRWNNIIKPSGSLVSTVEDMAKFGQMLLNKGQYVGGNILKSETFDLMWTPHYYSYEKLKERYALGLVYRLYNVNGKRAIGHPGGVGDLMLPFLFYMMMILVI